MSGGCPFDPTTYLGTPMGMFHCPNCGCMVIAGCAHPVCDFDFCTYGVLIDYSQDQGTGETHGT